MAGDYEEAERRIAEAKASGATRLSLIGLDIERFPESLGTLTGLQQLDLGNCSQLTDVSVLSTLKGLQQIDRERRRLRAEPEPAARRGQG